MKPYRSILFVCQHGAAKSVLAAVCFQHLADQTNLPFRAMCAGIEPDPAIHPAVVAWLRSQGWPVPDQPPRAVTPDELRSAFRIISFGCDLSDRARPESLIDWGDVPPVSEGFSAANAAIVTHVEQLCRELSAVSSCTSVDNQ